MSLSIYDLFKWVSFNDRFIFILSKDKKNEAEVLSLLEFEKQHFKNIDIHIKL